ncbi:MAG TPA: STAS domain-containing protein [Gaiellaceae bacterium]
MLTDRHSTGPSGMHEDPVSGVAVVGRARVVTLRGELDVYNSSRVQDGLDEACAGDPERVVIDLGEVGFIDSTALGVLIEAGRKLGDPRALVLAAPGLATRRALEISGLDRHFTLRESVQDALDAPI